HRSCDIRWGVNLQRQACALSRVNSPSRNTMREVLKSNNPVELSYAEALLKNAGIGVLSFDDHMSVLDGSMVILPRRLMVDDADLEQAKTILSEGLKALPEGTPEA